MMLKRSVKHPNLIALFLLGGTMMKLVKNKNNDL